MNIIDLLNVKVFNPLGLTIHVRRMIPPLGTPLIIIHIMGKVASTSIKYSLEKSDLKAGIFQTEMLTEKTWRTRESTRHLSTILAEIDLRESAQAKLLRKRIELMKNKNLKCKVITIAREPISQFISRYFHVIDWLYFPDIAEKYKNNPSILNEVKDYFLKQINGYEQKSTVPNLSKEMMFRYYLNTPLVFFDEEIKPVFDIDVYSSKFPNEKGYKIYNGKYADLLLIKFEKIKDCVEDSIRKFLNIESFVMQNANITKSTPVGRLYRDFLSSIVLPDSFVDKYYSSKYAQNFYSNKELAAFKKKWTRD